MDIEKVTSKKATATSKKKFFANIDHLKPFISVPKSFISDLKGILDMYVLSS